MPSLYDKFRLVSDFELKGDQPRAIPELVDGLNRGDLSQVLLGVTGSGKTQALVTLRSRDVRSVHDGDLVAVRSDA